MSEVWFARVSRNGRSGLIATDDESAHVIERMADGECKAFELIGIRDPVSFRRYWHLMTVAAKYCKQIEIDRFGKKPVYMRIFDKEGASEAMKLCVGHYDTLPVASTDYAIRIPRSISFRKMKPEEWAVYMPKVYDELVEKVAPEIADGEERADFLKCVEKGAAEAA